MISNHDEFIMQESENSPSSSRIGGIDEAGRGCVIGPMALAIVIVDAQGWNALKEIGVKDSKQLSPRKRVALASKIKKIALLYKVHLVLPEQIDRYCNKHLLNLLEAEIASSLIHDSKPKKVYIDAPGKEGRKFLSQLQMSLEQLEQGCSTLYEIVAENYADINYAVVSAASILAKVERDKEISKLHKKLGNFGSGYPGDPDTIAFLQGFLKKGPDFLANLPSCIRKSWQTIKRMQQGTQADLFGT